MIASEGTMRLAIATMGQTSVESIIDAARVEGWKVSTLNGFEHLRKMMDFECYDALVIAADTPQNLQTDFVRELLGHLSGMPVFFLFPPGQDTADCQAMLGVTSDRVTSTRPYHKAMSSAEALGKIRAGACTQFDPRLAAVFVEMVEHHKIMEQTDKKQLALTEINYS